jgi:hypothetical protein
MRLNGSTWHLLLWWNLSFHVEQGTLVSPRDGFDSTIQFGCIPGTYQQRDTGREVQIKYILRCDCSRNEPVKAVANILSPLCDHLYVLQLSYYLPQKHCLSLMRLDKSDFVLRSKDGNRNPWKTSSGANVGDAMTAAWKKTAEKEGLAVMEPNAVRQVPNSGEIQPFIPPNEGLVVFIKLFKLEFGQKAIGSELRCEKRFEHLNADGRP